MRLYWSAPLNKLLCTTLALFLVSIHPVFAATHWKWIDSDDKYGHFYAPETVEKFAGGLTVWEKTAYSYEGAKETIEACSKSDIVPDPSVLTCSIAKTKLLPAAREKIYLQETYYDKNGKVLWSDARNIKTEISPYCYDETVFYYIISSVYHTGDFSMLNDGSRKLYVGYSEENGNTRLTHIDTLSIKMRGDGKASAWEIETVTNPAQKMIALYLFFNDFDFTNKTIQPRSMTVWMLDKGWVLQNRPMKMQAQEMIPDSQGDYELQQLKAWIDKQPDFVTRYSQI